MPRVPLRGPYHKPGPDELWIVIMLIGFIMVGVAVAYGG